MKRNFLLFLILFAFGVVNNCLALNEEIVSAKGVILNSEIKKVEATEIDYRLNDSFLPEFYEEQILEVKILSGQDKNKVVNIVNRLFQNPFDIQPKKGDKVFLYGSLVDGEREYAVRGFWHLDSIIIWTLLFFVLVLLLGKSKGLKSFLTLILSLLIIFFLYIPLISKGFSPVLVAVLISIGVSFLTLPIIHGFSFKALVSIVGTLGGVGGACFFLFLFNNFSHLNGLGTEEMRFLVSSNFDVNFQGILFSGIIIGALGAIMDVAVSIASGVNEIRKHKPNINYKDLVRSGIEIGKDIMGSMLNTLVFAYIGTSVALVLMISHNGVGVTEFLNYDFVAEEIIRSIIGSMGLLVTIPITAIVAGFSHRFCKEETC